MFCDFRDLGIPTSECLKRQLWIPQSLSSDLGKLTVIRLPDVEELKHVASVLDSLEELYIRDHTTFKANTLKDFSRLKHVHVQGRRSFEQLSTWLTSHCPHIVCHQTASRSWLDW